MPYRLKSLQGFPYRFGQFTGPSPFLQGIYDEVGKSLELHRSRISLRLLREDVLQYSNSSKSLVNDPAFQFVLNKVSKDFRLPEPVKMIHFNDVLTQKLDIWSSSPGLPYRLAGFRTKGEVRDDPRLCNNMRWLWHKVKTGQHVQFPDSCAYVRSHLAPPGEEKCRAVWGYPMVMTLGEAIFALPLIRAYSSRVGLHPIAYGYETANGGTRRVVSRFSESRSMMALDYKSFDKTVPAWLIRSAFYVLEQNIDFLHYQDHGTANINGVLQQWHAVKEYFINTPIRLPNGERYLKKSGVASGSYFTQLIDSVVNAILINYIALKLTGRFPKDYIVFGDDSLISLAGVSLNQYQSVLDLFGMSLNLRKSRLAEAVTDLDFLGYSLENAVPNKPHSKWLCALLFPEHPDTCWDQVASRALGLYYANLGVDGRFHAICHNIIQTSKGCDLALSRDLSKMLKMMGFDISQMSYADLPTEFDLYRRFICRELG